MLINIIRSFDDHEPVILGTIEKTENKSLVEVQEEILALWDEFQKADKDCDNEFMDELGKHGYKQVYEDTASIVLE